MKNVSYKAINNAILTQYVTKIGETVAAKKIDNEAILSLTASVQHYNHMTHGMCSRTEKSLVTYVMVLSLLPTTDGDCELPLNNALRKLMVASDVVTPMYDYRKIKTSALQSDINWVFSMYAKAIGDTLAVSNALRYILSAYSRETNQQLANFLAKSVWLADETGLPRNAHERAAFLITRLLEKFRSHIVYSDIFECRIV